MLHVELNKIRVFFPPKIKHDPVCFFNKMFFPFYWKGVCVHTCTHSCRLVVTVLNEMSTTARAWLKVRVWDSNSKFKEGEF